MYTLIEFVTIQYINCFKFHFKGKISLLWFDMFIMQHDVVNYNIIKNNSKIVEQ
jgi:hypothetical protein